MHKPVLLDEVLMQVESLPFQRGFFIDGTFGRGGHSNAILSRLEKSKIIALDRDAEATEHGKKTYSQFVNENRLEFHQLNYRDFNDALLDRPLIGALLDLGVSSPQLDEAQRGFSFYHDGPLDMRMDQSRGLAASEIINTWAERDLETLFVRLGEIQRPRRVVQKIIERRKESPFQTTLELATLIEKVDGWRKRGHHPATNYFLALRMQVNGELEGVEEVLPKLIERLEPRGRILVITFHSLEDRIVKRIFREAEDKELGVRVNKKVIVPSREEQKNNPRSRSAQLRVFERGDIL